MSNAGMAAGRSLCALLGSSNLRSHFGGEIVHTLFDALSDDIQGKAVDRSGAGL
jgi:hypothetical protein